MQEVEAMCDRVIIINKGLIVADAKIHELQDAVTSLKKKKDSKELSIEEIFHILTK